MREARTWAPTKFVQTSSGFAPSRNPTHLAKSSRLVATCQLAAFEPALRRYARGRLLDLGCGEVPWFAAYREQVEEVVCVDWSQSLHAGRHVDVTADLAAPLPLPSDAFDTVLLTDVLEHLTSPSQALGEMARVMRVEGHLLATVPFLYPLHEVPHDYFRYTEHALRKLCSGAGLEVLELTSYGGAPEVIFDIVGKTCFRGGLGAGIWASASSWFRARGPIHRWSERTRAAFPLGYVFVARRNPSAAVSLDDQGPGAKATSTSSSARPSQRKSPR